MMKTIQYLLVCTLLISTGGWAQTRPGLPVSPEPACDLPATSQTVLMTQERDGFALRASTRHRLFLPMQPVELIPAADLTLLVYPGHKIISYQMIEDEAYDRAQDAGVSMPQLYRKVYGLMPLQPGDEAMYNIASVRRMMNIQCGEPNFHRYILRGGDTAIVQWLEGRYWTLIFPLSDSKIVYNLEFRNFSETEVKAILGTWEAMPPSRQSQ